MSNTSSTIETSQIVEAILNNTMAVMYAKDLQGRYQLINQRFEELFGMTANKIKGRTDFDIFPNELAEKFRRNDVSVAELNQPIEFEEVAPHEDGPHIYISLKFPYRDKHGKCIGTCGVSTDITPRKRVEAALKESEERFRQLAEHMPECFWITDVKTWRVLYVNPAFERIWQRSRQEIYDCPEAWIESIHPADRQRVREAFMAQRGRWNFQQEYRILLPDDSIRWIADRGFPIRNEAGEVYRLAGIAEDITERRALEQQVIAISSHERQRISNELHDSLGQQLTGLGYLAKSLTNRLAENYPAGQETAEDILEGIQDAIAEVRRVVRGLAPVDFDAYGLKSSLQELATSISNYSGLKCDFICHQTIAIENSTVATQLYRIAQEATNNAVKHSGAKLITMSLRSDDTKLRLEVRDDGNGNRGIQSVTGMGLRIMGYRSNIIGADFNVESTDEGTTVSCTWSKETHID